MPTQNDFDIIKAPGLYQYDGGVLNSPSNSPNFRSIELGSSNRYSQIAMPWDSDQMFFRRKQDATFTPWREIIHTGNIGAYTQQSADTTAALDLKADKATTYTKTQVDDALALKYSQASATILQNYVYDMGTSLNENYYLKGETLQIVNAGLALKQDSLIIPSEGTSQGFGLISDNNVVRRLSGDNNIQVQGVLDLQSGSNTITDIKVSLNTNPTFSGNVSISGTMACSSRMTGKMFFCAGKVNADGTKAFTSSSGWIDFTCSVSSNTYTITFNSSHPAGSNYVIQVTGQGAIATVLNTNPPTATSFRVVLYSASTTWPTTTTAPFSFSVLH
jgi:hypothetical protein